MKVNQKLQWLTGYKKICKMKEWLIDRVPGVAECYFKGIFKTLCLKMVPTSAQWALLRNTAQILPLKEQVKSRIYKIEKRNCKRCSLSCYLICLRYMLIHIFALLRYERLKPEQAPTLEDGLIVYLTICPKWRLMLFTLPDHTADKHLFSGTGAKPRTIHSKPNENCTAGTNSHTWGNISN